MDIAPITDPRHEVNGFDPGYEPPGMPLGTSYRQRPPDKKLSLLSASDLRTKVFPPIKYVVPGFIVEGCTLLAGRPKLGKSWLVLDMALAVADNRFTLNQQCVEGDVLYLALEDNQRRLKGRIDKILGPLAERWPARLQLATECPRSNEGGVDAIREWANSVPSPRLVVVDVLAMFKPTRGDKETLYEADYRAIKALQELAAELNIAIIVVHHTRKGAADSDPFEKVSGTLGLSGAADTTIILDRDQNGFTIYGRGRDIQEFEHAASYNHEICRFSVLGKAEEVRRTDERSIILDVLKDADEPMSPADLSAATRMSSVNLRQLLFKMGKAGEVTKVGRGHYRHPERLDLDNKPTPDNNDHKITKPSEKVFAPPQAVTPTPETQTEPDNNPDHKITTKADIRLSVPATDLLKWLRSRTEQPVNTALISNFAPRHTRSPEVRPLVIAELTKANLIRGETRTAKGKKPSRFIHLIEGGNL